jgi:hypothetical protein
MSGQAKNIPCIHAANTSHSVEKRKLTFKRQLLFSGGYVSGVACTKSGRLSMEIIGTGVL